MSTLDRVVTRLVDEVGLPRTVSLRIARKMNALAQRVDWATPLEDGRRGSGGKVSRRSRGFGRLQSKAARKRSRKAR